MERTDTGAGFLAGPVACGGGPMLEQSTPEGIYPNWLLLIHVRVASSVQRIQVLHCFGPRRVPSTAPQCPSMSQSPPGRV